MSVAMLPVERFQDLVDGPGELSARHDGQVPVWDNAAGRLVMVALPEPKEQRITVRGGGGGGGGTSTIAGAEDFAGTTGAATDGYAIIWDDSAGAFTLGTFEAAGTAAAAVTAHVGEPDPHTQYLLESDYESGVGTTDTRANILASSPDSLTWALASDTAEILFWDGSAWHVAPLELNEQANATDMGLTPPMVDNDRSGYSAEYITDKSIYNSRVLGSAVEEEGSVRTSSGAMQVYLNGTWNDVVTGFRFREDDSGAYELEHKPIGFTWWIEVLSGNSDELGLNGLPLAQQYQVSMGAYPVHQQVVGREITA